MNDLEIFVITNERSTFKYVMKSLESQSVSRKITVVSDMLWVDALRYCANTSKSEFYIRVDDDMFIHKHAMLYYVNRLKNPGNIGVYECKLWEDWSSKPAGSLRAYRTKVVKEIGFHPSKLGKVDKVLAKSLAKTKYRRIKDSSMVGIHSCSPIEDQKKYRDMWLEKNSKISKEKFEKTFDNIIHPFYKSLDSQFEILNNIKKLNRKYRTDYYKFLKGKW